MAISQLLRAAVGSSHHPFPLLRRANELRLVWDPPTSDGDLPLRLQLSDR